MSVVTEGIINMPFEMAMSDELMRRQYYQTVRAEIASLREKVEQKDELIAELQTSIAEIDDDRLFWRGKAKTAEAALAAQSDIVAAHTERKEPGRDSSVMHGWLEKIAGLEKERDALKRTKDECDFQADRERSLRIAAESLVAQLRAEGERKDAALRNAKKDIGVVEYHIEEHSFSLALGMLFSIRSEIDAALTNGGTDAG